MSGGGLATKQASIEPRQRVQAKQGQGVADRVRIQSRIAVEHSRDVPKQIAGLRQGVAHGMRKGHGVCWSVDHAHASIVVRCAHRRQPEAPQPRRAEALRHIGSRRDEALRHVGARRAGALRHIGSRRAEALRHVGSRRAGALRHMDA